ncbi:MAG: hypothetical protein GY935_15280 [Gammaproteobacteria bacterium]|nr:hypothetical protein [Gammaproteobacteria bacterium]
MYSANSELEELNNYSPSPDGWISVIDGLSAGPKITATAVSENRLSAK